VYRPAWYLTWGFDVDATAARLIEESSKARANGKGYAEATARNAAAAVERSPSYTTRNPPCCGRGQGPRYPAAHRRAPGHSSVRCGCRRSGQGATAQSQPAVREGPAWEAVDRIGVHMPARFVLLAVVQANARAELARSGACRVDWRRNSSINSAKREDSLKVRLVQGLLGRPAPAQQRAITAATAVR
jgi:hypothetical protein